jgi:hypothetical protein
MHEKHWELIIEVQGELQAELMRGLLESQGIPVRLNQEGAGRAYGLNIGPLGSVQILAPSDLSEAAHQILNDYYAGKFAEQIDVEIEENDEDE